MITQSLIFIAGLMLLIKGADYLVDGASSIAQKFGISALVIGLTIVAFGTSAPELAVSLLSVFNGASDIAIGNVNGSNIANILLILGITTLFARLPVKSRTFFKEVPFMLLAGFMILIFMLDPFLDHLPSALTRTDGIALLGFFSIFMYYMFLSARDIEGIANVEKSTHSILTGSGFILLGLGGLVIGGKLAVDSATSLALMLGVSQSLVAVTIVAVGTSLPELVTSVVAARKGHTDMAIGGIVGSNIFNILFILGVTATVSGVAIPVSSVHIWDATIALAVMIILFIGIFIPEKGAARSKIFVLTKREGIVFLALYVGYIAYIIVRG